MVVDFIMNGNIEERWDGYVGSLEGMGLDNLLGIYEKGYQEHKN